MIATLDHKFTEKPGNTFCALVEIQSAQTWLQMNLFVIISRRSTRSPYPLTQEEAGALKFNTTALFHYQPLIRSSKDDRATTDALECPTGEN